MIKRYVGRGICVIVIALSTLGACGGGDDDDSGGASKSGNDANSTTMQSGTGGSGIASNMSAAGMGGGASGNTSAPAKTNCMSDQDCGISQECVACGLNDTAGWCSFKKECMFDSDCMPDKCGYNVKTSDYRCLPKMYCPD